MFVMYAEWNNGAKTVNLWQNWVDTPAPSAGTERPQLIKRIGARHGVEKIAPGNP
jgi:hypothetical protein